MKKGNNMKYTLHDVIAWRLLGSYDTLYEALNACITKYYTVEYCQIRLGDDILFDTRTPQNPLIGRVVELSPIKNDARIVSVEDRAA
jgi:hypothetical protein